jgi:Fe-Mn family superoxide dismutase
MSSVLREISSRACRASVLRSCKRLGIRHNHTRRALPYPVEEGLGKFLPPQALQTLEEYQDGLLKRLDDELRSMPVLLSVHLIAHFFR